MSGDEWKHPQEQEWVNPRDQETWLVRAYYTGQAMGTSGSIPAAGEDLIQFRKGGETYSTTNPTGEQPDELTEEEKLELFDRAKAEATR